MSKDLHTTIVEFFRDRMRSHSRVLSYDDISTDEFVLYRIHRKNMSPVVVYLSDAYRFTRAEFLARPRRPAIDYILIARPEATDGDPMSENWEKTGVGNLAGIMGALNKETVWEYSPPKRD